MNFKGLMENDEFFETLVDGDRIAIYPRIELYEVTVVIYGEEHILESVFRYAGDDEIGVRTDTGEWYEFPVERDLPFKVYKKELLASF